MTALAHSHRAALPRQPSARDLIAELRRHRKALGLKQYVFALEAGIPQPRLCGYETGRLAGERMELRTLLRWVEALGGRVTVEWLTDSGLSLPDARANSKASADLAVAAIRAEMEGK